MSYATKMLIDGRFVDGDRSLDVYDPATGDIIATVACASEAEAERAIKAAKAAQPGWEAFGWEARKAKVIELADALAARAGEFAEVMVREQGKPLHEAKGEVAFAEAYIRHFASLTLPTETIQDDRSIKVEVRRKALGVVLGITPWNFPLLIPATKLAPALLAGNTIVLKPAASTPISALMLAEVSAEIFPRGVINVVVDDNDLGSFLSSHPDVAKITFTGSTSTGRKIMASGAPSLKRLTLELGGNDAAIVLADVDVAETAAKIFNAAFYNAGQACLAVKRVYVEEGIYDGFCEAVAVHARRAVVGNGLEEATQIGPMQNAVQFAKARHFLDVGHRDGKVIAGGTIGNGPGHFVNPTVVRDIEDGSDLVDQEQFSPILPIVRVSDAEDALARANNSDFGLGGSIWSKDLDRARDMAARMQTGTVWINQHLNFGPKIPFAGAKQSGIGVEYADLGLAEFCQISVVNEAFLD